MQTKLIGKIASGGQTGADRGALNAAIKSGLPYSGWCPKGRLAEDGTIPERYRLTETSTKAFRALVSQMGGYCAMILIPIMMVFLGVSLIALGVVVLIGVIVECRKFDDLFVSHLLGSICLIVPGIYLLKWAHSLWTWFSATFLS